MTAPNESACEPFVRDEAACQEVRTATDRVDHAIPPGVCRAGDKSHSDKDRRAWGQGLHDPRPGAAMPRQHEPVWGDQTVAPEVSLLGHDPTSHHGLGAKRIRASGLVKGWPVDNEFVCPAFAVHTGDRGLAVWGADHRL